VFEAAGQHRGYSIFFESSPDRFQSVRRKIAEAIAKAHPSDGMIAGTPEDLLREAERLVAAGSWRAALFKAKDALFLDETNFEAGEMELVCYRRLGMRTETAEAALWLVRRHSSSAEAYRVLGDAYAWNARLDEACEAYQQALDKGLAGKEAERVEALLRENRFPQPGTAAFRLALPDVRPGEERGSTAASASRPARRPRTRRSQGEPVHFSCPISARHRGAGSSAPGWSTASDATRKIGCSHPSILRTRSSFLGTPPR